MKSINVFLVLLATNIFGGSMLVSAQKKGPDDIKRIVESQNYIFKANRVNPHGSISRELTSDYDLTVTRDTIISYLPYFGRAYVAPINVTDGGIKFTSAKFEYKQSKSGKGWEIAIRPRDASDVQQLNLDIFDNGVATLRVISTNRQSISFNGYIEEKEIKGKKAF